MKTEDRTQILNEVVNELLKHKETFGMEYNKTFSLFDIKKGVATKDNLHRIFSMCVTARRRVSASRCKEAIRQFDEKVGEIIEYMSDLTERNAKDKHKRLFNNILGINGVGPKIATEFIKTIVYWAGIWPELKNELYVPVDKHVHNLMVKKLKVFDKNEVPDPDDLKNEKWFELFENFQRTLSEIRGPRIDFDLLWFIGSHFSCKLGIYCDYCFIRKYCQEPR